MSAYKKELCGVVMLFTEKVSPLYCYSPDGTRPYLQSSQFQKGELNQHLYLISNREIIKGDWVLIEINHKWKLQRAIEDFPSTPSCKLIEATTDESLGLPLIPEHFLEDYIENEGGVKQTYIETYTSTDKNTVICRTKEGGKYYVNIIQAKTSWSSEEIIDAIEQARKALSWTHSKDGLFISEDWLYKSFGINKNN